MAWQVIARLDIAYRWICKQRRHWPANADIWSLRARWPQEKAAIQADIAAGHYGFSPQSRFTKVDGAVIDLWSSRDALVLKALAIVLADMLPVSERCAHVKGNGGAKGAVREAARRLADHRFVMRTDVKSYYASIDHIALLDRLAAVIGDRTVLNLIGQYLRRTSERGGIFTNFDKGLSRGCPLSPLMGAFFLHELDVMMERAVQRQGLFYVRYMDDILVLAPTRWKLRRAVRAVNRVLSSLGLEQHPDKTFIGRIARGFDFLGYRFSTDGQGEAVLTLAAKTIENFKTKLSRLYEQWQSASRQRAAVLEAGIHSYEKRWFAWAAGGPKNATLDFAFSLDGADIR